MIPAEVYAVTGFVLLLLLTWSPLLAFERIRALFAWPTRWFAVNYVVVGTGVVLAQCVIYLAIAVATAGAGTVTGGDAAAIVGGVALSNVFVPGACSIGAVRLLPQRDVWSPDGGGLSGRIALGIGVVWYAIVATATVVIGGLVLMFAHMPM